jgi:hypothetical protein
MMTIASVAIGSGSSWLFALGMCLDTAIIITAIVTFGGV